MPDESRAYVSTHSFWKWGTSALFDIHIVNLDAGSYLYQTSAKALKTAEKKKNRNYLQPCLERRHYLPPMVYSADEITRTEAVASQRRLASLLINKMKR